MRIVALIEAWRSFCSPDRSAASAIEFAGRIRARAPDVPVILLVDKCSEDCAIANQRRGARADRAGSSSFSEFMPGGSEWGESVEGTAAERA
jgi:hypothetical protein